MKKNKVFVTGGTGFIGSHLVDRLLDNGDNEVYALIRSHDKWLDNKTIQRIKGDLHDAGALREGMNNAKTVFHVAGLVKAPESYLLDQANVDATENVLRMAMKQKVTKLVILSSLAACGPGYEAPLSEEDPLRPVTMYGKSKKKMEEMVHRVADDDISVTIIRPPAVYGPRENQIFSVFQMASWRFFPIIGDGHSTKISLVHVDDLIDGIMLAAAEHNPGVETYFITSEQVYTWNEISITMEKALQKRLFTIKIPHKFVQFAGAAAEHTASLFGRYPVVNRDKAKELGLPWICSADKAKSNLGYRSRVSLYDGFSQTINWYKKNHWL